MAAIITIMGTATTGITTTMTMIITIITMPMVTPITGTAPPAYRSRA